MIAPSPTIHTFTAPEGGLLVNAYLIEGANGVVAVDATLTRTDSRALRDMADALRKPLLAVLITHAHPDHVAGIATLVGDRDVPVVATDAVARLMRATEAQKLAQWGLLFGDEWIHPWTHPNRLMRAGEALTSDGMTFRVHDLGPGGDCDANAIWILEDGELNPVAAFVGDLVFNGTHSYLADGKILAWLANIERVRPLLANTPIYPGHGPAGATELLDRQRDYLLAYCGVVRELAAGQPELPDGATATLEARVERLRPGAPLGFMIGLSAGAVASELAG